MSEYYEGTRKTMVYGNITWEQNYYDYEPGDKVKLICEPCFKPNHPGEYADACVGCVYTISERYPGCSMPTFNLKEITGLFAPQDLIRIRDVQ